MSQVTEELRAWYLARRGEIAGQFATYTGVLSAFVFSTLVFILQSSIPEGGRANIEIALVLSLISFATLLFATFEYIAVLACRTVEAAGGVYFFASCTFTVGGTELFAALPFLMAGFGWSDAVVDIARLVVITIVANSFLSLNRAWGDLERIGMLRGRPGKPLMIAANLAPLMALGALMLAGGDAVRAQFVVYAKYLTIAFYCLTVAYVGLFLRMDAHHSPEGIRARWSRRAGALMLLVAASILWATALLTVGAQW